MTKNIDINQLFDRLKQLQSIRQDLLASDLSPEGAWIHEYTINRTYPSGANCSYTYAKWQSQEPIFRRNPKKRTPRAKRGKNAEFTCHQHIGRTWSSTGLGPDPLAISAYQEYENRLKLEAIENALAEINLIINVVTKKIAVIERNKRLNFE